MSARDSSDVSQERQVLDNALFSLQALASCMAIPPTVWRELFRGSNRVGFNLTQIQIHLTIFRECDVQYIFLRATEHAFQIGRRAEGR
jgi:hypothetical protein